MNSIPGREPRADTLGIHQPKETHKRGCYLALTFGTLLSSQGADAQRTGPFGLRPWRLCPTVRLSRIGAPEGAPMALTGLLGATQTKIHEVRGVLHARSATPSPPAQATPAGRNCTLTRGPTGRDVFGTQCSHVRWQEPPMTTR